MRAVQSLKKRARNWALPQPVPVRHAEYSMIFSADDDKSQATPELIDMALQAIGYANRISLQNVCDRMDQGPYYPEVWPGEGYKLLAGFAGTLKPKSVLEIGTGGGTSTLSMLWHLPEDARITTFDIIPWQEFEGCLMRPEDFEGDRVVQYLDDLSRPEMFQKHRKLFEEADLIFMDASKDGSFEKELLAQMRSIQYQKPPVVLFDDIRVWNMLKNWREIDFPKLDLTSFGHWTGTGLVLWGNSK